MQILHKPAQVVCCHNPLQEILSSSGTPATQAGAGPWQLPVGTDRARLSCCHSMQWHVSRAVILEAWLANGSTQPVPTLALGINTPEGTAAAEAERACSLDPNAVISLPY